MNLIYKTLFEIQLLHEFFLKDESGVSIFDKTNSTDRDAFLENEFITDHESINQDIAFEFPEELNPVYDGYHLKLLPTYSGCKVLIRVNKKILPDNSIQFEPFVQLPDNMDIFIIIVKNNELVNSYTNSRISKSIPSLYFFSNENIPDPKTFPFLINNIAVAKNDYIYEQGELALGNTGNIVEYYYDKDGVANENLIKSAMPSFANENDRLLLPLKFDYSFINNAAVTQVEFDLKDTSGNIIKSISISQSQPITRVTLDFSDKANQLSLLGIFTLQVTGNNGFSESNNVVFSNTLYSILNWGVINIKTKVSNTNFNILTDDGYLKWQKNPATNIDPWPAVFLIPVKSKYGYYRYTNDLGLTLELTTDLQTHLIEGEDQKSLITKVPVAVSNYYFLIPDNLENQPGVTVTYKYFPNPVSYVVKKDDKNRVYLDVVVPNSDMFPAQ